MKKHIFLLGMLCLYQSIASLTTSAQSFIQNVGQVTDQYLQTRNDIDFKISQQKGMQVYIGNGKIHYQWINKDVKDTTLYQSYRLDMELIGANIASLIDYGSVTNSYERYFLPWVNTQNSNEGKIAHQYQSVTYKNIYPDIDWKLYFTADGKLEYDFILGPKAKVTDIKMRYSGMDSIKIANGGQLEIYTPKGIIREQAPYSYESESKKKVNSSFVLQGETIGFKTEAYKGGLTIDPIVEWGTYLGGNLNEKGNDCITDKHGNIYLAGTTNNLDNIITSGAHQVVFGGNLAHWGGDGFVAKFSSDGVLKWVTYYGGINEDNIVTLQNDTLDNIYFTGITKSNAGITTANSHKETFVGSTSNYDVYLVKLDSNGVRQWASYWGGNMQDGNNGLDMTVTPNGTIYLVNNTLSNDNYISANAYKSTRNLGDVIVSKWNTDGTVIWSTYYGGTAADVPTCITLDTLHNIYFAGYTQSNNGIALGNAFKPTYDIYDAFIVKMDSLGNPIWGTYYGGNDEDRINSIAVIDTILIVGGYTGSTNNIASTNAHQNTVGSTIDGFIAQFDIYGNRNWGTYIGGSKEDYVKSVKVTPHQDVYVYLETFSDNNIATANGIKNTLNNIVDGALIKFDQYGNQIWGTYIGGADIENITKMHINNNEIFLTGATMSNNMATTNAFQTTISGASDAFIIKINDCDPPTPITQINGDTAICAGDIARFEALSSTDAAYYTWILPSAWLGNSDSSSINVTVGTTDDTIKVVAFSTCGTPSDTMRLAITVLPLPQATVTRQGNVLRTTTAFDRYQWLKDNEVIAGATQPTYIISENGDYSVIVTNIQGCSDTSNVIIISNLNTNHTASIAFSYYPNPISDVLHIQSEQAGQLILYNVLGQLVMTHNIAKGSQMIDCHKLATGIYKIQLIIDQQYHTFTITKE